MPSKIYSHAPINYKNYSQKTTFMKATTAIAIIIVFIAGYIFGAFTATTTGTTTTLTEFRATTLIKTTSITTTRQITATTTIHETHMTTVPIGEAPGIVNGVCFSRPDRCDALIAELLGSAKHYAYVAVYSFTNDLLADALIELRNRDVDVKVVIEEQQVNVRGSEYMRLKNAGIDIKIDGNPDLMHHKFVVIDDQLVITGSYNWSMAAEDRNDENLVVISGEEVARLFRAEFERVWSEAR